MHGNIFQWGGGQLTPVSPFPGCATNAGRLQHANGLVKWQLALNEDTGHPQPSVHFSLSATWEMASASLMRLIINRVRGLTFIVYCGYAFLVRISSRGR